MKRALRQVHFSQRSNHPLVNDDVASFGCSHARSVYELEHSGFVFFNGRRSTELQAQL